MFNSPSTPTKSKSAGIFHQSSRQTLLFRSAPTLNIGKWHLKTVVLTLGVVFLLFLYAQKMDFHSDSRYKRRELVVRPAKPYKSPYHRRRPTKQPKTANSSLRFVSDKDLKNDTKLNKTKSALLKKPPPNPAISNKDFQEEGKQNIVSKLPHEQKPEDIIKAQKSDTNVPNKQEKDAKPKYTGLQQLSQNSKQAEQLNVLAAGSRLNNKNANPSLKVDLPADVKTKVITSGDFSKAGKPPGSFKIKIVLPADLDNKITSPNGFDNRIVLPSDFSNKILPLEISGKNVLGPEDYKSKYISDEKTRNKIIQADDIKNEDKSDEELKDDNFQRNLGNEISLSEVNNNKIMATGDVIEPREELQSIKQANEDNILYSGARQVKSELPISGDVKNNMLPKPSSNGELPIARNVKSSMLLKPLSSGELPNSGNVKSNMLPKPPSNIQLSISGDVKVSMQPKPQSNGEHSLRNNRSAG